MKEVNAWITDDGALLRSEPKQGKAWCTTDDRLFTSESEAKIHESRLRFCKWYDSLEGEQLFADDDDCPGALHLVDPERLLDWVFEYNVPIFRALREKLKPGLLSSKNNDVEDIENVEDVENKVEPKPETLHAIREAKGLDETYLAAKKAFADPQGEDKKEEVIEIQPPKSYL